MLNLGLVVRGSTGFPGLPAVARDFQHHDRLTMTGSPELSAFPQDFQHRDS
jgi:hypothetical protein